MRKVKILIMIVVGVFICGITIAQNGTTTEANTGIMRSSGKIYVVVTVLLTILGGLFFYLFRLESKISKLEKEG